MKKSTIAFLCIIISFMAASKIYSQGNNIVSGNVKNSQTKENLAAVSVTIKSSTVGTFTDEKGNFRLVTTLKPPFTIVITSIGYTPKEIAVDNLSQSITTELEPTYALGQEIVVAASRLPERILESPVTIERVNTATILQSPATSYYDIVSNLKGVDVTTSSLTFKTPTTRGFNGSGNARFNQLVDGIDNQAPGLNFSVGNVIGLTELDVDNMELLSGASSALYGSGGMNGTLLISSKNPFKYQGLSVQVKEGIMNLNNSARSASPYNDISMRWGVKVSDRFAFKIGAQYIIAKDWLANDQENYSITPSYNGPVTGTRQSDPNYNGVNLYGDETNTDIYGVSQSVLAAYSAGFDQFFFGTYGIHPTQEQTNEYLESDPTASIYYNGINSGIIKSGKLVSRTGYQESDVVPKNTINFKVSGGLYYKITNDIEASIIGYWGNGNSVYTGSDRYALKDLKIGQYKAEVKAKNWFVRVYTTQENSGEAYNATVTSRLFNEAWDPSQDWYPKFTAYYIGAIAGGQDSVTAANYARSQADQGRPAPGSAQFNRILDSVRNIPIPAGGLFLDRSDLWNYEGQLNLTDILKVGKESNRFEVLVGANFKQYLLKSEGTLFDDNGGTITINETGAYVQVGQKLGDILKLTASGRYDKNENFKGKFTPRFSAVITVADNQNIRLSYQNAYRFPTTQNQWIDLYVGDNTRLLGGLPQLREKYHFDTNPVYTQESVAGGDPSKFEVQKFGEFKPETANSFEAGYKGLFANKFLVDLYGYFTTYQNFLTRITVFQDGSTQTPPLDTLNIFSVAVNSPNTVKTSGWGASFEYQLRNNFFINANIYGDYIGDVPDGFKTYYNTPKLKTNVSFGNRGLGKTQRFGFNIIYRWQDSYYTESDFRQGDVPAYFTLDAQVSYKLPKQKILFKLGGTNVTNHYYRNAFGNPYIGALYYASIGYNVF